MAKKILSTIGMIILLSLLTGSWNVAIGDPVINYQGRLTNPNGNPINGVYKIVFKVYEQETGGSALWMENYNAVPVSSGFFSVKLGSITSLTSVDFSKDLWLGITVESDSEMNPRLKLGDVPHALGSRDNFAVAGNVNAVGVKADGVETPHVYANDVNAQNVNLTVGLTSAWINTTNLTASGLLETGSYGSQDCYWSGWEDIYHSWQADGLVERSVHDCGGGYFERGIQFRSQKVVEGGYTFPFYIQMRNLCCR